MTSVATGYDSKAWDTMSYFYDTQAWLPKNVTFMNKAAFDQLDKPTQESLLRVAAAAEARGWWRSQDRTKSSGRFVQLIECQRGDGQGGGEFAVGVVAGGRLAEFNRPFINFVGGHQFFGKFGAAPQHHDKQSGGVGVKRAAVADFFDLKPTADGVHHVMRSRADRFIDKQRAVERVKFVHESVRRVEDFFEGGDHAALNGQRLARDARAGGGRVSATAKLTGDFTYVHGLAFGAQGTHREKTGRSPSARRWLGPLRRVE